MKNLKTRILFLGDICGKPGRKVLSDNLQDIKEKYKIDVCIGNGENLAHGRGTTAKTADEVLDAGIDVLTGGNHTFKYPDIFNYLKDIEKPVLRPANFPDDVLGKGYFELVLKDKRKILVVNLLGRSVHGMNVIDPFRGIDKVLELINTEEYAGIIVDIHAEATSEKIALGLYLDGRVSAVIGTHTHVQTADERILSEGSAYITDVGMVGPKDSVLWVDPEVAIETQMYPYFKRFEIKEDGPDQINAVIIEVSGATSANSIKRVNLVFK